MTPAWRKAVRPQGGPAPAGPWVLGAVLLTGLLSTLLLGSGIGPGLLLVASAAAGGAAAAARAARRRARPWTLAWAATALLLLAVPALSEAGWPVFLALAGALAAGSLALHGGRRWAGVLLGAAGLLLAVAPGAAWAWEGLRARSLPARDRWWPVLRAAGLALVLLLVFGALFAGADAAFADLLSGVVPSVPVAEVPLRVLLFGGGAALALAAARTAASPRRWDRLPVRPARPRGLLEWALPLVVLDVLFAVFIGVQLVVLFGGYAAVLRSTGLTYAQYARQGFWQLLCVTVLTLAVVAAAHRRAPRATRRDTVLVRCLLGTLCLLTVVVVASALRRMQLYVDAYGLTQLRVWVGAVEIWLGAVLLLLMAAGLLRSGRWLPRAVALSAAVGVLAYGLASPDALVARQNVSRFDRTGRIDLGYLRLLSADAVPALDRLPEPQRSCALEEVAGTLERESPPWYAASLSEARARALLRDHPLVDPESACDRAGQPVDEGRFGY
ncbi:DUF4173 domain-containing protein [Streptacidiphilus sp. ASG 303]|uniref:DUF4153 domain-containing protein n=1 Tax=Streptacidiphilus sp. ASG 303 TaxID=2896847 RepID=UPI001E2D1AB6|nr:DUF4173 domain-containing protein [Streptacidiphilus sp. ASG 303]MCD0484659.1 DUF4173 domain-containing protein [Streptacidiphilus sp. ASG 303]